MQSGTSLKIKVIKWNLSLGFCIDLRFSLLSFTNYMCESMGGAKQAAT